MRLRRLAELDRQRLDQWLRDGHVQRWWGNRASAEAEIALALGSEAALCRIIEVAGAAIGYAHAIEATAGGAGGGPAPEPGSWDCRLFIASEPHRGKGYGQRALDLLAAEVFEATLALACTIIVSIRNEAAVRGFERAGFRWTRIIEDPLLGPCWLLRRERGE